jgi:hypothetical protein
MKKYPVNFVRLSVERNVADDGVAFMVTAAVTLLCRKLGVTVMDPLAGGVSKAYVNMYVVTALLLP